MTLLGLVFRPRGQTADDPELAGQGRRQNQTFNFFTMGTRGREEKISEDNATFFRNLLISGTHPPPHNILFLAA